MVCCKTHTKTTIFARFSERHVQKQQYLPGFLQHTFKNNNIYNVFCKRHAKTTIFTRRSAARMQKQQYLQGVLQQAFKNTNIYKVFVQHTCKNRACPICGPELSLKCRRAVLWLPLADSIESAI